jgi:hypothetical protein
MNVEPTEPTEEQMNACMKILERIGECPCAEDGTPCFEESPEAADAFIKLHSNPAQEGFDFAKLKKLNHAGGVVNLGVPNIHFEELKARSLTKEVRVFAEELEVICNTVNSFKEKYPQVYS